ncbi:ABC transporter ATP-binding protein [Solibacillus silvestris]
MNDIAIKLNQITKKYKLYNKPVDRLKESLTFWKSIEYSKEFYALNEINIEFKKGESVGIIGKNGSGKSTLLKIITGVLNPTSGTCEVNGHISAILELGAGFNPEYTGIENIMLSGTLMGYSNEEIAEKVPEILEFADIGDFIYQPVKNYSSGMYVRLAFSVAISVNPEILIVDEALSVGDIRFQQKCLRKIEELKKEKTILFVSHDLLQLNKFCDRLIWINEGNVMSDGSPEQVSKEYQAFMAGSVLKDVKKEQEQVRKDENQEARITPIDKGIQVFGDNKAEITGIDLYNSKNTVVQQVLIGESVTLAVQVKYNEMVSNPIVGFTFKDRIGTIVAQTNSFVLNEEITSIKLNESIVYKFNFTIPSLKKGNYTISPAIASGNQYEHVQHCWIHDALIIKVDDLQEFDLEGYMILENVNFETN